MRKFGLLLPLLLVSLNAFAQKSTKLEIHVPDKPTVALMKFGRYLMQNGFELDQVDKTFLTIQTKTLHYIKGFNQFNVRIQAEIDPEASGCDIVIYGVGESFEVEGLTSSNGNDRSRNVDEQLDFSTAPKLNFERHKGRGAAANDIFKLAKKFGQVSLVNY